jgi:hypothetical protein
MPIKCALSTSKVVSREHVDAQMTDFVHSNVYVQEPVCSPPSRSRASAGSMRRPPLELSRSLLLLSAPPPGCTACQSPLARSFTSMAGCSYIDSIDEGDHIASKVKSKLDGIVSLVRSAGRRPWRTSRPATGGYRSKADRSWATSCGSGQRPGTRARSRSVPTRETPVGSESGCAMRSPLTRR